MVLTPRAGLRLALLGGFTLTDPAGPIKLGLGKACALLAYLVCNGARPQARDTLATLLWGSRFDAQARQSLRQALTKLRGLVGDDVLVSQGDAVAIKPQAIACDAQEFEALCANGTPEALAKAIELYKGRFLDGLILKEEGWVEWVGGKQRSLDKLAIEAMLRLGAYELVHGDPSRSLALGGQAIGLDGLREDSHRLVLSSLAALQRRTEALKHYVELTALLRRELDVQPETATKLLADEIKRTRHTRPGAPTPSPAARTGAPAGQISANGSGGAVSGITRPMASAPLRPLSPVSPEPLPPTPEPSGAVHPGLLPATWPGVAGWSATWLPLPRASRRFGVALMLVLLLAAIGGTLRLRSLGPMTTDLESRQSAMSRPTMLSPVLTEGPRLQSLKHCEVCPEMVVLPAGEFIMGSPYAEEPRKYDESPQVRTVFSRPFAIGRYEVTVDQFEAFVREADYPVSGICQIRDMTSHRFREADGSFRGPGFSVTGSHPAVCVSLDDVKAYADWLVRKTGKLYRLPSEAEWEYAARAGTTTTYPWGEAPDRMCEFARFADLSSPYLFRGICVSGRAEPGAAPVGSLKPNAWGLHDMLGNAWEWVEDCWQPHYRSHPSDGAALAQAECDRGVVRGGGWHTPSWSVRPARRAKNDPAWRVDQAGFRIALTIEP